MTYEPGKSGVFAVLAISAILIALPFGCMASAPYSNALPRPFNSERWKAIDNTWEDEARCGMLADLRYRVGVEGKTQTELFRLLGEPEDQENDPSSSYWILCPSFLDYWVLRVQWQNDKAVSALVHDT